MDFKTEFHLVEEKDSRYKFLLCVVFCQALCDLLKKLEGHQLSLCILERKKKNLDYENFIGLRDKRGDYYHCKKLFDAYKISVPDEIYKVYFVFKATEKKLYSMHESNVLEADMEKLLIELFDTSYYEQFKAESLKYALERDLPDKDSTGLAKI